MQMGDEKEPHLPCVTVGLHFPAVSKLCDVVSLHTIGHEQLISRLAIIVTAHATHLEQKRIMS